MGAMLTKPCMSTIVERKSYPNGFKAGLAEMNGWRNKMEDAHVIRTFEDSAFFGVFDGHGGEACSAFVAKEFYARLEAEGLPKDDETLTKMILDIDEKFLASGQSSGSTGSICIVHRPTEQGGKFKLRVANIGDSRVLLGKRDGTIVDGGGTCTDQGLTTDHKPNDPVERERIYRCGGYVETQQGGVARVNGDLAVSRAFGDAQYKETGGPAPEDRPVTAAPELGEFTCDEDDFLIIVCDGVSEGDFPNPEVVKLISQRLIETNDDVGATARDVIFRAEEKGSKDNITCMIITFNSKDGDKDEMVFTPGPIDGFDEKFMSAYEAMSKRADRTLAQAVEERFDAISEEVKTSDLPVQKREDLNRELAIFGSPEGEKGSSERREWFETFLAAKMKGGGGGAPDDYSGLMDQILRQQRAAATPQDGRRVKAASLEALKAAVEAHPALKWDDRLQGLADSVATVQEEDKSDGTMKVRFEDLSAWIPTSVLDVVEESGEASGEAGAPGGGYDEGALPPAPVGNDE